jgi:tetratricopeptide (TPR) repeat protein
VSAEKIDRDNVERRTKIFRADHRHTLFSYRMLARDLYGLGRFSAALEMQREKLRLYEQNFQVRDHPTILFARRNMAIFLRKTGQHKRALEYATQVFDVHRRRLGRRHEHTLASMLTLCNTLRVIGVDPSLAATSEASLQRARELGQEALETYGAVFGTEHPFTLGCATDLAIVYRACGMNEEAMELDERTYVAFGQVLKEKHPHVLCSASNRTNNLALAGRFEDALAASKKVLDLSLEVRAHNHPLTLACATNHALDLAAAGRHEEASALRIDTLDKLRTVLGANHPETINMERGRRAECDIEPPEM